MKVWLLLRDRDGGREIKAICASEDRAKQALEEAVEASMPYWLAATGSPPSRRNTHPAAAKVARFHLWIEEHEVLT